MTVFGRQDSLEGTITCICQMAVGLLGQCMPRQGSYLAVSKVSVRITSLLLIN